MNYGKGIRTTEYKIFTREETYTYTYKHIPKEIRNRNKFKKITQSIVNQIAKGIKEEPDGVYLDKFGYFFVMLTPRAYMFRFNRAKRISTRGRKHIVVFRPPTEHHFLADYILEYKTVINKEIDKLIEQGRRYIFNPKLFRLKYKLYNKKP